MRISVFANGHSKPIKLTIYPTGAEWEIPHLGEAGVRCSCAETSDRSHVSVDEHGIVFWCEDPAVEVDVVSPTPLQMLLWDICVNGGWCGGLVDGKMTHVYDLWPDTGIVSAHDFALMVVKADGDEKWEGAARHIPWLEDTFEKHLGASSISASNPQWTARRPFDQPKPIGAS
ncbi:hypothetical protein H9L12_00995 [Sphingomonas rhizophila]|uniref:Uncharacterized protein n=1 Tax=Sphingomonas rhizophila TaxID=2071607 RepID=A0A7G9SBN3_9SPHN|nr:hypothetical protein [Sphingomonas rhizophila]QNN65258.1 hypothetical protein H9L12_00995 [Sphingomonas rhizophila]